MGYRDKSVLKRWKDGFIFAGKGIRLAFREERHMRFHVFFGLAAVLLGVVCGIALWQWIVLLLAIAGMLVLEMVNSALERLVNLVSPEWNKPAGDVKDIAAGAVLIYAVFAVIIGVMIFMPFLWEWLS
jgi:undecaprenol kinase